MTTFLWIVSIILVLIIIGLILIIRFTWRKMDKMEEIISLNMEFIEELKGTITKNMSTIDALDVRGRFSSDDEIGYAFKDIKEIYNGLNNLIRKYFN